MNSKMFKLLQARMDAEWHDLTNKIDTITETENLNNPQVIKVIDKLHAKRETLSDIFDMMCSIERS